MENGTTSGVFCEAVRVKVQADFDGVLHHEGHVMVGDRPGIEMLRTFTRGLLGTLETVKYPGVSAIALTEIRNVRLGKAAEKRVNAQMTQAMGWPH